MSGPTQQPVFPLPAWGLTLALALLVFLLLAYAPLPVSHQFRSAHEMLYATYKVRLHNLRRASPPDTAAYRVLIFGSSLTEHAVAADAYFRERFREMGKAVEVRRVFYAGANYQMLEDADLRAFLLHWKPHLLCLEDQVLLYRPLPELYWPEPPLTQLHRNYVFNLNVLKHRLLPAHFPEPGLTAPVDSGATFDIPHPRADSVISASDSVHYQVPARCVRRMGRTPQFNQTLQGLRAGGTDVAVLHLPRAGPVEKRLLPSREKRKRDRLLRRYQEEAGMVYWRFAETLPFRYYWDAAHFNKYGQAVYSSWLFERIAKHMEQ